MLLGLGKINYWYEDGGVAFSFHNGEGSAFMQWPDNDDSEHTVNGKYPVDWNALEDKAFRALQLFYFNQFKDFYYAVASIAIGKVVNDMAVISDTYEGRLFYVVSDTKNRLYILTKNTVLNEPWTSTYFMHADISKEAEHRIIGKRRFMRKDPNMIEKPEEDKSSFIVYFDEENLTDDYINLGKVFLPDKEIAKISLVNKDGSSKDFFQFKNYPLRRCEKIFRPKESI